MDKAQSPCSPRPNPNAPPTRQIRPTCRRNCVTVAGRCCNRFGDRQSTGNCMIGGTWELGRTGSFKLPGRPNETSRASHPHRAVPAKRSREPDAVAEDTPDVPRVRVVDQRGPPAFADGFSGSMAPRRAPLGQGRGFCWWENQPQPHSQIRLVPRKTWPIAEGWHSQ